MTGADGGAGPGVRPTWRWDVALSFAGAQRDYVEQVAEALQAQGVRCFYDADEQIELWGKYLAEELPAIYGEQAAAVVVFVSAEYAARDWTRHERRAALVRAVRERREYVLPARFDDTPLPGLLADMVAVDLRTRTPQQFAAMISDKLAVLGIAAPSANAGDSARDVEAAPPAGAVRVGEVGPLRRGHRVGAVRTGTLRHVTAVENEPDPIAPLDELVEAARKEAQAVARQADALQVIAFFDLSGSTRSKLERGNASASQAALTFTSLASSISARFGGRVLKTLGDGALATFNDPLAACRAALNLRYATHELLDLEMTAGLTSGRPLRIALDGDRDDVLGDVVDRAARIQSLALPGQVLIDATLYSQVRADIAAQPGWQVDPSPRRTHAKGIGPIELFELCLGAHWRLKKELATPFDLIISGRPTISEKLALISNAKSEIIEIGIGLTSFAQYFTGQKPEEFRDPIRQLVRGGVNLKCFALDFGYEPGNAWLAEQDNRDYPAEAAIARRRMGEEGKHYRYEEYRGRLSYYTYRRVPEFWCLGVDVDDPLDGRMFFAPYLMDVPRSASPVVQVSRTSNPDLYGRYLQCVHAVRAASDENRR